MAKVKATSRIEYSVSLWNYRHYAKVKSLEREIRYLRDLGYGVELWAEWGEERDLFDERSRARLAPVLQGMTVSLHGAPGNNFEQHQKQIGAAAYWGAGVIVVHTDYLSSGDEKKVDPGLAAEVVAYSADHGVQIALENGQLPVLVEAIEAVEGLKICLDIGHVYQTPNTLGEFLNALEEHIVHLHLQDVLSEAETGLKGTSFDHYLPGTGGIPKEDWNLLAETLEKINYQGIAVFEIRPRNPRQMALAGSRFMNRLFGFNSPLVDGVES